MWWQIYFWFLVVVMVLPFPFKLAGYALRKDPSPTLVKIEETANGVFLALGLIPLYGFIHGVQAGPATLWYGWLCIGFLWSVAGLFWSPKLSYAAKVLGKNKTRVFAVVSVVMLAPMLVGVYLYARQA